MINSEITRHVSSKINEFKVDLNVHIRETIEQVISDQVLPTIRETLGEISSGARLKVDFTSSERCITARKFVIIYQNWIKLLVIEIVTILRTHLSLLVVMKITTR